MFVRRPRILLLLSTLLWATGAGADTGDLDPTFGTGGKVNTDFNSAGDRARAVAIQLDGKIVTAGEAIPAGYRFALARYNTDGSLDATFGLGGQLTTNFGFDTFARDVALQSDGKIVVAGYTIHPQFVLGSRYNFITARYNSDGTLDNSFGTSGHVQTPVGIAASASAVAIQSDGKILVGGNAWNADDDFALVRYNSDGSLDNTFGTGGMVTTNTGGGDRICSILLPAGGKIVVAGGDGHDFVVARYTSNGTLDNTFGVGGIGRGNAGADEHAKGAALQSNGKIVVVGSREVPNMADRDIVVMRFTTAGALDIFFGNGGKVITDLGDNDADDATAVVVQSDHRIVVSGGNKTYSTILRYKPNGILDTSFGTGGAVFTDFGNNDYAHDVALQSDGMIVVSGESAFPGPNLVDFTVMRFEGGTGNATPGAMIALQDVTQSKGVDRLSWIFDPERSIMASIGFLGGNHTSTNALAVRVGNGADDEIFAAGNGKLMKIDPISGFATDLGSTSYKDISGMAWRSTGQLYAVTYGTNKLLTLKLNGKATVVAHDVLQGTRMNDIAFNPSDGKCYVITDGSKPRLYEINVTTGKKINRWDISGGSSMEALLFSEDGARIYSVSDRGASKDLCELILVDNPQNDAPGHMTVSFLSAKHSGRRDIEALAWFHSGGTWSPKPEPLPGDAPATPRPSLVLHQNRPNPFNPTTRIEFELARPGEVELLVLDVRGHRVATLVRGPVLPGSHSVLWSGRSDTGARVASGVYFYALKTAQGTATRRMALLK